MQFKAIKTDLILDSTIEEFLDTYISQVDENSIFVFSSKVIAICQKRLVDNVSIGREELIRQNADIVFDKRENKYNTTITITNNILAPAAGIDRFLEKYFVLWPSKPMETAREIRDYLANKSNVTNIGVIIADSKSTPLVRGVTSYTLGYAGFIGLRNNAKRDICSSKWVVNLVHPIAAAAGLVMGEQATELKPIVVVSDIPFIEFGADFPTDLEREVSSVKPSEDLFHVLFDGLERRNNES